MKKVKLISVIVVFCSISAATYSQTDSVIKRSKPNEIGLNLGPVLLVAMGSDPYSQPIGITYKRLRNKLAYKLAYNYHSNASSPYSMQRETQYVFGDSVIYDVAKQYKNRRHDFRLGAEYRLVFKNKINLFLGADLIVAYAENSSVTNKSSFKIDSISSIVGSEPNYYLTYIENKLYRKDIYYMFNTGLGLNVGMIVPISKRFQLSISQHTSMVLRSVNRVNKDYQTNRSDKHRYNSFDFDFGLPITEIGFYYRF